MKKISVIVKEKTVLELNEDAKKGDIIDLKDIVEVDSDYIEAAINEGKDKVYLAKLQKERELFEVEKRNLLINSESKIKELEVLNKKALDDANNKNQIKLKENDLTHQNEYAELLKKYEILEAQIDFKVKENELLLDKKYQEIITRLNNEKLELEMKAKLELEKTINLTNENKNKEIETLKASFIEEKQKLEEIINTYQRQKANLNVKQTGEDLEVWCDNEVNSYMQNGLFNCIWEKDNTPIKNDDETKGSKADFIFSIYASNEHLKDELLAKVCLEMKDENPDSVNKKRNSDHYKKLDENRNKKECKYAVLVSNLELDKPNILPIYKVREYENMYVVRPAYLMTFLNMITSLSQRFASLVLERKKEDILFKDKEEILEEFDSIKHTYLDKPLDTLSSQITTILNSSKSIKDAATKIDDACEKINSSYIRQIFDKIARFELKFNKINNKIDKLS